MTIDRRSFFYAGGLAAAAAPFAAAAPIGTTQHAPTVLDFGVEPNATRDQTAALQKAIDELTKAKQPVILPSGVYRTGPLSLPPSPLPCAILGTPGSTVLLGEGTILTGERLESVYLSGLTFDLAAVKAPSAARISLGGVSPNGAAVTLAHCQVLGTASPAIKLDRCHGTIQAVRITGGGGGETEIGIIATRASGGLSISQSTIADCRIVGIEVVSDPSGGAGEKTVIVTQNTIARCGIGISADSSGIVSGNIVSGAKRFGLKLGGAKGSGHILAQSNLIRDCRIGIGVSASGDDIMASLNMIAGAKEGAIRAFDGDKLVGPDLARQSAEAYLNLMVAGNVVR
jgi:Pectate lyase superfamily protein